MIVGAQRHIAIDRQWRGEAEGANAANRAAGDFHHVLVQRAWLAVERITRFAVVDARVKPPTPTAMPMRLDLSNLEPFGLPEIRVSVA